MSPTSMISRGCDLVLAWILLIEDGRVPHNQMTLKSGFRIED
jgi:hypothetical protein